MGLSAWYTIIPSFTRANLVHSYSPNPHNSSGWFLTIHDIQRQVDFEAMHRGMANIDFPAIHRRMATTDLPTAHRRMREQAVDIYSDLPTFKELACHLVAKLASDILSIPGNVAAGCGLVRQLL